MSERGMSYNEARARVMRITSAKTGDPRVKSNLVNSILNQARIREGQGAVREIVREVNGR